TGMDEDLTGVDTGTKIWDGLILMAGDQVYNGYILRKCLQDGLIPVPNKKKFRHGHGRIFDTGVDTGTKIWDGLILMAGDQVYNGCLQDGLISVPNKKTLDTGMDEDLIRAWIQAQKFGTDWYDLANAFVKYECRMLETKG
ncbi:21282_t:CDS:2, partial [Gigaspora rosea]